MKNEMELNFTVWEAGFITVRKRHAVCVVSGYNPDAPEDQQWDHGSYFPYWEDTNKKVQTLSNALEYFRCLTEENYIPRERLIELATRFKDCESGDEDLDNILDDMEENEVQFFGLEGRVLRDEEY